MEQILIIWGLISLLIFIVVKRATKRNPRVTNYNIALDVEKNQMYNGAFVVDKYATTVAHSDNNKELKKILQLRLRGNSHVISVCIVDSNYMKYKTGDKIKFIPKKI